MNSSLVIARSWDKVSNRTIIDIVEELTPLVVTDMLNDVSVYKVRLKGNFKMY